MNETEDTESGQKLLSAVERIADDPDEIIAIVDTLRRGGDMENADVRKKLSADIIDRYSTRSAISGGVAALPGIVPGLGTLVAFAGGTLVDMAMMLKFEVEMAMALSWVHGFDIRLEKERQIALLLASVSTYEAKSGRNYFVDLAEAEGTAIWNYAPRQVSKILVSVMTKIALLAISKGFARTLPVVGIVVGSGMNKVLTRRVGKRCAEELGRRRKIAEIEKNDLPPVDAKLRDA